MTNDDARTKAGGLLRDVILELVAEEEAEARVIHERVRLCLHLAAGKDIDHCGHHFLRRLAETRCG